MFRTVEPSNGVVSSARAARPKAATTGKAALRNNRSRRRIDAPLD
jgi:hypothetical protein